jgi:hypothetical protein
MKHDKKIKWMEKYAARHNVRLQLKGHCGFGRKCVGILGQNGCYPDYQWHKEAEYHYDRIDNNGDVWMPEDAYHKHECVAVLGRGREAESQLYEWLKWFDDNHFEINQDKTGKANLDEMQIEMGEDQYSRMVRKDG